MAYYDPYNNGLRQPTGPMTTPGPSRFEKLSRAMTGEVQRSSGFKLAGTGANIKNYPADLLRDSGMAKDAGLRANATGAAKMGGRLLAAGNTLATLAQTGHDVATTSTEDYQKRLGIDEGSFWAKSDTPGAQFGKDLAVRGLGAVMDFGTRAADSIPFLNLGDRMRDNFADKQPNTEAIKAATQPAAPAAPAAAQPQVDQKAAAAALDQKMVAESPNGYVEMPPQKGLRSNTYTNVPSQIDNFANAKGTVSTIEGPGVDGFKRQLNTIRSLREPETPVQDRIHVISNPGWATLSGGSGNSVIAKAMEAIDNLPRDMSSGNKAEAVAHLLGVANSAKQVDNMATRETARSHSDSGSPSFRDLLEVKKFQYQVGRDQLQDGLSVDANNRNNRLAGATLAATGQNIEKGREDIASKQFESMFRKQDDKGNDIADTGSVGRFRTELAQAIDTLANSGDKNDVARFGTQYKKADGSTGLRARHWDELTDSDKAALVRGFKFADHARKYADGGDRGGNFAEYMRGRKDAQGRVVFGSNGKTRAIVDAETLNSNGASSNPLVAVNPFDKRKFGIYEPRDFSEFYK